MPIATVDPATGETVRSFDPHDAAEIERRLARAAEAAAHWRTVPVAACVRGQRERKPPPAFLRGFAARRGGCATHTPPPLNYPRSIVGSTE